MNRKELKNILDKEKISPHAYSIYEVTNPPVDEQYVLDKAGEKWRYYYYERGLRTMEQFFDTEDGACRYMLRQILNDPNTRLSSYNDPSSKL